MKAANWPPALRELAQLVEKVSGNMVPEGFYPFLAEVARERQLARRFPELAAYVRELAAGRLEEEWRNLLSAITVKESYFFRTPQHFHALAEQVIPQLARARQATRTLRLWSAGCARGEEPATLALVLAEHELLAGWSWSVLATDVDEEALAQARLGLYSQRAVAGVPEPLKTRYFTPQGELWLFSPGLRQRITFRLLNLVAEPFPPFPQPFDVIFLRNVLIYFRLSSQQRVLAQMAKVLAEDGYLFLGPAETVWQVSDRFEPVDLGDCFAYRKRAHPSPQPPARQLTQASRPPLPPSPKARAPLRDVPPPPAPTPALRPGPLAEAVQYLAAGQLPEAQAAVRQALAANPADAQAYALEGILQEVLGNLQAAVCAFRAALYLEGDLYQARLLLAHNLRRLGQTSRARAEYRQLLAALAAGRGKELDRLGGLPLPTREQATRQAHIALEGLPA